MFNLTAIEIGKKVTINKISGSEDLLNRLATLGLFIGIEISILQTKGHGGLVVAIKGQRLAIGLDMAKSIYVEY